MTFRGHWIRGIDSVDSMPGVLKSLEIWAQAFAKQALLLKLDEKRRHAIYSTRFLF
jgi:hypothetical protein